MGRSKCFCLVIAGVFEFRTHHGESVVVDFNLIVCCLSLLLDGNGRVSLAASWLLTLGRRFLSFSTVDFLMCRLSVFHCQSLSSIVVTGCCMSCVGCRMFGVRCQTQFCLSEPSSLVKNVFLNCA